MSLRIAAAQIESYKGDVSRNIDALGRLVEEVGLVADVLVLPELFLGGYDLDHVHETAFPMDLAHPHWVRVRGLVCAAGIGLVVGFAEQAGSSVYNSLAIFDSDGSLAAVYRKTHLWGSAERTAFRVPRLEEEEGEKLVQGAHVIDTGTPRHDRVFPVFRLPCAGGDVTFGALVCYDAEFVEPMRILAARHAHVVFVPTASTGPSRILSHTLIPARAYENHVAVVYVNYPSYPFGDPDGLTRGLEETPESSRVVSRVVEVDDRRLIPIFSAKSGSDEESVIREASHAFGSETAASEWPLRFSGNSVIYGADAALLATAGGVECVVVGTIPPRESANVAAHLERNPYLHDRQVHLYGALERY